MTDIDNSTRESSPAASGEQPGLNSGEMPSSFRNSALTPADPTAEFMSGISDGSRWSLMSAERIDSDRARHREIVKGKVRQNLGKYISDDGMIGRKGKDLVSIPVPQINPPKFRFGQNGGSGVGQGDGEVGDPVGGNPQPGDGPGQAGGDPGDHMMEVEVTFAELAEMLGDELELPNIEEKGKSRIQDEKKKYNQIRRVGPEGLRDMPRTFREALKRQMATGDYDSEKPVVIPERLDMRYRDFSTTVKPHVNAAIVYIMDVSGSMTDEQKSIVRTEAFWIDTWLKSQYKDVEVSYIIHDAAAKEVDEHTFYHTRESGGTRISSAYKLCDEVIQRKYPPSDWNIYVFHFSDGDNWGEDNRSSLKILKEKILPVCNMFCYGQVASPYGSGEFLHVIENGISDSPENLALSEIEDREDIKNSIKTFLGKGR